MLRLAVLSAASGPPTGPGRTALAVAARLVLQQKKCLNRIESSVFAGVQYWELASDHFNRLSLLTAQHLLI